MQSSSVIEDIPFIDITKYRKYLKDPKKPEPECIWLLDDIHDKPVEVVALFGKLMMPICARHLSWHKAIMTLVQTGKMDILDVLTMSRDVCMAELIKRGLIIIKRGIETVTEINSAYICLIYWFYR